MEFSTSSAEFEGSDSHSAFPSIVEPKLRSLLNTGPSATDLDQEAAHTASGLLDLLHKSAYDDDLDRASARATKGLASTGTIPDIKLALYRLIASVHHKLDDEVAMQQAISQRTALLRSVGQTHQADMEDQLGSI